MSCQTFFIHYKDLISYFKAYIITFDVSNKSKNIAHVVPLGLWQMGMMKSYLAALEGLVNLHHQRSAASPDILAYSEGL